MSLFDFFKKDKGLEVSAPTDGTLYPITEVTDDVFSEKMLGDGFAVKPSNGEIFAPVAGKITTVFPTKHAIGISTTDGLEILLHLGIDTVELNGTPFEVYVEQGDEVKQGQKLAKMDVQQVVDSGRDSSVIVVYTNMNLIEEISPEVSDSKDITHSDNVQTLKFKK